MGLRLIMRKNRLLGGLIVALAIGLVFCLASGLDLFHGVRILMSDQLFKAEALHNATPVSDDIVIVAIDEPSLAELGRFAAWPRAYHAALVDRLNAAGARLIVFDILFSETTPDDGTFAAAMASAGNVILPYAYTRVTYASTAAGRSIALENRVEPQEALKERALIMGHALMLPDEDGIVRTVPLYLGGAENLQPSLALASVAAFLRRPQVSDGPVTDGALPLAGREIPVDGYGNMLINYTEAGSGDMPFTEVSYSDVLAGTVPADLLRGKIALIGVTATGLGDAFWTPLGKVMNGVELHGTAMQTVLADHFLRPVPGWAGLLIIIGVAAAAGVLMLKLRLAWASAAIGVMLVAYVIVAGMEFDHGVVMDLLFPPLAMIAAGMGVNGMQMLWEQAEKREIAQTFGRYVSPEVAGRILTAQRESNLELQGVNREMTALSIDARRFTALMEEHAPETVFRSLNLYMRAVIASIQRHQGIVNKFAGDGLLAVWNAPVQTDDHAVPAVRAALTCQQAIRQVWDSGTARLAMEFGIGIMTGDAYAGTMGTRDRMEYSIFGDVVNAATRLSGMAPGNRIWIGEETYRRVQGHFTITTVGEKTLRGRQQTLNVYEVTADGQGDVNIP
jgi:adenylate cyclase